MGYSKLNNKDLGGYWDIVSQVGYIKLTTTGAATVNSVALESDKFYKIYLEYLFEGFESGKAYRGYLSYSGNSSYSHQKNTFPTSIQQITINNITSGVGYVNTIGNSGQKRNGVITGFIKTTSAGNLSFRSSGLNGSPYEWDIIYTELKVKELIA